MHRTISTVNSMTVQRHFEFHSPDMNVISSRCFIQAANSAAHSTQPEIFPIFGVAVIAVAANTRNMNTADASTAVRTIFTVRERP